MAEHAGGNRKHFRFYVDGKEYESTEQFITGGQLRAMAHIENEFRIFLEKHREENEKSGHRNPDRIIHNSYSINLAEPGEEKFYTLHAPSMDIC